MKPATRWVWFRVALELAAHLPATRSTIIARGSAKTVQYNTRIVEYWRERRPIQCAYIRAQRSTYEVQYSIEFCIILIYKVQE